MELIIPNPNLPARAGSAKLEYFPIEHLGNNPQPSRIGREIRLPLSREAEFHPLHNKQQFIFSVPIAESHWQARAAYFGGQDEEPFLVRLDPRVLDIYRLGGEKSFYEALVPEVVRRAQRVTQTEYRRQGDIFAVPVDLSWRNLSMLQALQVRPDEPLPGTLGAKNESLFGTRHLFTGMHLSADVGWIPKATFREGEVEAPDHADLKLKGIFLLAQTAFLFDPKNAD